MDLYTLDRLAHQHRLDLGKRDFIGTAGQYVGVIQAMLTPKKGVSDFDGVRQTVTRHAEEIFLPIGEDVSSPHYMSKEDSVGKGIAAYINLVQYAAQKKAGSLNGKAGEEALKGKFSDVSPLNPEHHFWAKQCRELSESSARVADRLFKIADISESRYRVRFAALTSLSGLVEAASQSGHAINVTPYKKGIISICKDIGVGTSSSEAPHEKVYAFWTRSAPGLV